MKGIPWQEDLPAESVVNSLSYDELLEACTRLAEGDNFEFTVEDGTVIKGISMFVSQLRNDGLWVSFVREDNKVIAGCYDPKKKV